MEVALRQSKVKPRVETMSAKLNPQVDAFKCPDCKKPTVRNSTNQERCRACAAKRAYLKSNAINASKRNGEDRPVGYPRYIFLYFQDNPYRDYSPQDYGAK